MTQTPKPHAHDSDELHDHSHEDNHAHSDHDHAHDDHAHDHPHGHSHDDGHTHGHDHDHSHGDGVWGWVSQVFHLHGHRHQQQALAADTAFADNNLGIRTVWLALAALAVTAILQIIVVWMSGSVALLADTVHNIGDGLNSVPLLIAFYLARRAATRRYNYGFARAEDVAGVFIVLSIAFSAGVIFWQSFQKLIHPQPLSNLGWVAAAAVIGFAGNELVAVLQIRVGRKIGSAALVADGQHARTDGLTSLAVLVAAVGAWVGLPILDPIIGFLIGITILFITKDAAVSIWYRLMDAVEPETLTAAEEVIQGSDDVQELRRLRMRWMGHRLHAEVTIAVDPGLTTAESHHIAEHVRHALFHAIPYLAEVVVHVDPYALVRESFHEHTVHHEHVPAPIR
jgi:cation diffusion facilitator family transporter